MNGSLLNISFTVSSLSAVAIDVCFRYASFAGCPLLAFLDLPAVVVFSLPFASVYVIGVSSDGAPDISGFDVVGASGLGDGTDHISLSVTGVSVSGILSWYNS